MTNRDIFPAWWHILRGRRPFLSVEITKECPLRCPGCYAYSPEHLEGGLNLRSLADYRGVELVTRAIALIERLRPLHISIVGGEPLVRYRELGKILTRCGELGIEVQVVTSAVRPIPAEWARLANVHLTVSIDGLAPEHDRRRAPATYERILKHIAGHRINAHCTITRQMRRPGYLREFAEFWSARDEVRKIWFSLYTPQDGEQSAERLTPEDRAAVLGELWELREQCRKLDMKKLVLEGYARPPQSPRECVFAQVTTCLTADLRTRVEPCQFGGKPVCTECGCIASAGMAAIARTKIAGLVPLSAIFTASQWIGRHAGAGGATVGGEELDAEPA